MCIYKQVATGLLQNASSSAYCDRMAVNRRKIVTDKLRSYGVAHRELIPETIHSTHRRGLLEAGYMIFSGLISDGGYLAVWES